MKTINFIKHKKATTIIKYKFKQIVNQKAALKGSVKLCR